MDVNIPVLLCMLGCFVGVFGVEPSFDVPVINVTVREGDIAILPCSVDYLGEHKVVWTDQWSTLLTLDDRRIIDDPRISIERPYTRDWNLHIRKTAYSDRGKYTCQINTNPIKTKTVVLFVLVPSKIVNERSSQDQTVREGETVTLVCNVTGEPTPEVTWYKLPNDGLSVKERLDLDFGSKTLIGSCAYTLEQKGIGTAGEVLMIHNVSRYCDGIYECVAYNNVDPAVTRQIKVYVEFQPEVKLPNKRMGQFPGRETILDCEINAYPHGITRWQKDGRYIGQTDSDKYHVELYSGSGDSTLKTLSLRVRNVQAEDFGEYTCYAENVIGTDSEDMILYDYSQIPRHKNTTSRPVLIHPTPKIHTSMSGGIFGGQNPWSGTDVVITRGPGRNFAGTGSSNNLQREHSYGSHDSTNKAIIPGGGSEALSTNAKATKSYSYSALVYVIIGLMTSFIGIPSL
ncbi:hypothetical protein ACF0H5_013695 [Mactra antiquata]